MCYSRYTLKILIMGGNNFLEPAAHTFAVQPPMGLACIAANAADSFSFWLPLAPGLLVCNFSNARLKLCISTSLQPGKIQLNGSSLLLCFGLCCSCPLPALFDVIWVCSMPLLRWVRHNTWGTALGSCSFPRFPTGDCWSPPHFSLPL